ncbi:MAG: hypothetical protein ABSE69_18430, partial [Roseiarcus sp.]
TRIICACIVLLCGLESVAAGEIVDLARDAEAKLHSGQYVKAIESLRQALRLAHDQSALAFRKAVFVSEAPEAFGIYKERASNVFNQGEPLIAYIEPIGIGWTKEDGGSFHSLLTVDFEIRSPTNEILTGKRDFGRFEFVSREQNTEIMTHLTLNLTGAPPGKYILGVVYHDKTTGKSASTDLPFEIR